MIRHFLKLSTAICLSAVVFSGCGKTDSAGTSASTDNAAVEETESAPLVRTIDGVGIQLVKLQMPGMT